MSAVDLDLVPSVRTTINYIDPACENAILYEGERESSTLRFDPRTVEVRDARAAAERFTLARNGFELVRHPVQIDFTDPAEVQARYVPAVQALIRSLTGASEVLVFGEVLRNAAPGAKVEHQAAFSAHVDFDAETVAKFVRGMTPPDQADRLLAKRFALINLWRGIAPVERTPLAVVDAGTVARADLRTGRIQNRPGDPGFDWTGYNLAYSPAHRWWWFPHMQPDEVLVFKLCDSDPDRLQLTAHSTFEDPDSPEAAPPRRSFEIRTISFYED